MPRTLIAHTCTHCDTQYTRPKGANGGLKYCSPQCYQAHRPPSASPDGRVQSVDLTCEWCGSTFHPWPGKVRVGMRYCSPACRDNGHRRPLRDMSAEEIAWLAGLFDGEGHVGIERQGHRRPAVKISITNTWQPLLEQVRAVTDVGYTTMRYRTSPRHKPTYDWHTTGGNAVALLTRMRPWLLVKAERADEAIASSSGA